MKILCNEEILRIVELGKVGDKNALESLIEYYTPYIKSKCSKNNIIGFEFDDLKSEAIKTLLKCVDSYKVGETPFSNYFFRALSNEFNYLLRKSYKNEALHEKLYFGEDAFDVVDFEEEICKRALKSAIESYIKELTGVERTIMEGIYYRGISMAEIARKLKYPFYKVQYIRNLEIKKIRNNIEAVV